MKSIIMTEAGNLLQGPSQHDNLPKSGHAQRNPLRLWHERSPSGHMRLCKVWEIMNSHHLVRRGIARYKSSWTVICGFTRYLWEWEIMSGHHLDTVGFSRYLLEVMKGHLRLCKFKDVRSWAVIIHLWWEIMNGYHLVTCGFSNSCELLLE